MLNRLLRNPVIYIPLILIMFAASPVMGDRPGAVEDGPFPCVQYIDGDFQSVDEVIR